MNIEIHQTNYNGQISARLLCDLFSDVAQRHTEKLNIDIETLRKQGLTWMLHRMHIIIDDMPHLNDKIEIITHPAGINKLFAQRCFRIKKENGHELLRANSDWMIIDINHRRPIRPTNTLIELNKNLSMPDDMPQNEIDNKQIPHIFDECRTFIATFDNIDFNGHVTQASYIQWLTNSLSFEFLKSHTLTEAEIVFEHEILPDSEIISWTKIEKNNENITIWHKLTSNNETTEHCFGKTKWNNTQQTI